MTYLNINSIIYNTAVEGPYHRTALWVQGCSINCADCCNTHMLSTTKSKVLSISEIVESLLNALVKNPEIEGISILGGEPLDQSTELLHLLKTIKEKIPNYGVILFTGYEWSQLTACPKKSQIIEFCDLIIAGPYKKELHSRKRRWIGSDNQSIQFTSPRYKKELQPWPKGKIELEISISDREILVTGTPLSEERKLI